MLRSRTVREGSVGLFIIFGVLLFAGISVWLRGIRLGRSTYNVTVEFPNVKGLGMGDPVRYRGLKVGKISEVLPGTNGVKVGLEIDSSQLLIPRQSTIKTTSAGLIGETFIDIRPPEQRVDLDSVDKMTPFGKKCDRDLIICDGAELSGITGITMDDLFPLMYELSSRLAESPELFANMSSAAGSASTAADEIAQLSRNVSLLVTDVQAELGNFSDAAKAVSQVAGSASGQIDTTAQKYQATADKLSALVDNANGLLSQNRTNLVGTLESIGKTSDNLQSLVAKLDGALAETDTKKLVANLENLTANAAEASANLKEFSAAFVGPNSAVTLQQTLDSARVTFANAQKITTDLEAVTGDPAFLDNVRNLVNGLSNLVSSTQELEQHIYTERIFKDLQHFSTANSAQVQPPDKPAFKTPTSAQKALPKQTPPPTVLPQPDKSN
ncbi:MAG: MlaD family protein [Cyanobacteria bacterium J06642_3]